MAGQFLAKITGKGQITIPKALREALGFQDGEYLLLYPQGQGMRIEKAAVSRLERFEAMAIRAEERFKNSREARPGTLRRRRDGRLNAGDVQPVEVLVGRQLRPR